MKSIKPKKLNLGDTIGLVSPGSASSEKKIQMAVSNLEQLGFRPIFGKNAKKKKGYLAGNDRDRISDLHQFFSDDKIKGIWCLRGGYGSARLLPSLDYRLIRKKPKVLIGYSDITALLNGIYKKCGLIGFHGPMATSEFTSYARENLQSVLMNPGIPKAIKANSEETNSIVSGKAKGQLIGGNLSLMASLCGSPYLPKFKNRILFLEDIGEKPYRIDRMLTQLLHSTDLSQAAGIMLGSFKNCEAGENDDSLNLKETLIDRLSQIQIPVIGGFSFGHLDDNATLPVGLNAEIDTASGKLSFLESAVID